MAPAAGPEGRGRDAPVLRLRRLRRPLRCFANDDRPEAFDPLVPWAKSWRAWVSAEFLREYLATASGASFLPADRGHVAKLLGALTLDKALYELLYELNNRPDWVRIPLQGIVTPGGARPAAGRGDEARPPSRRP